jgi:N-acetylglucosamine malate deacetylase 2
MSNVLMGPVSRTAAALPRWKSVLVVVAHPDDESFGLGAVLDAFVQAGATVEVLCLTNGEASTLHGAQGDLAAVRGAELAAAADALGVTRTLLRDHPDGALGELCRTRLATEVVIAAESCGAQGLLVFDTTGVTGHPDHVAASSAALLAAEALNLPVLGWTLPEAVAGQLNQELGSSFAGHRPEDIDLQVPVDRERQRVACHAHESQALPGSVLWRRLELLGETESLRWLRPAGGAAGHPATLAHLAERVAGRQGRPVRVENHAG